MSGIDRWLILPEYRKDDDKRIETVLNPTIAADMFIGRQSLFLLYHLGVWFKKGVWTAPNVTCVRLTAGMLTLVWSSDTVPGTQSWRLAKLKTVLDGVAGDNSVRVEVQLLSNARVMIVDSEQVYPHDLVPAQLLLAAVDQAVASGCAPKIGRRQMYGCLHVKNMFLSDELLRLVLKDATLGQKEYTRFGDDDPIKLHLEGLMEIFQEQEYPSAVEALHQAFAAPQSPSHSQQRWEADPTTALSLLKISKPWLEPQTLPTYYTPPPLEPTPPPSASLPAPSQPVSNRNPDAAPEPEPNPEPEDESQPTPEGSEGSVEMPNPPPRDAFEEGISSYCPPDPYRRPRSPSPTFCRAPPHLCHPPPPYAPNGRQPPPPPRAGHHSASHPTEQLRPSSSAPEDEPDQAEASDCHHSGFQGHRPDPYRQYSGQPAKHGSGYLQDGRAYTDWDDPRDGYGRGCNERNRYGQQQYPHLQNSHLLGWQGHSEYRLYHRLPLANGHRPPADDWYPPYASVGPPPYQNGDYHFGHADGRTGPTDVSRSSDQGALGNGSGAVTVSGGGDPASRGAAPAGAVEATDGQEESALAAVKEFFENEELLSKLEAARDQGVDLLQVCAIAATEGLPERVRYPLNPRDHRECHEFLRFLEFKYRDQAAEALFLHNQKWRDCKCIEGFVGGVKAYSADLEGGIVAGSISALQNACRRDRKRTDWAAELRFTDQVLGSLELAHPACWLGKDWRVLRRVYEREEGFRLAWMRLLLHLVGCEREPWNVGLEDGRVVVPAGVLAFWWEKMVGEGGKDLGMSLEDAGLQREKHRKVEREVFKNLMKGMENVIADGEVVLSTNGEMVTGSLRASLRPAHEANKKAVKRDIALKLFKDMKQRVQKGTRSEWKLTCSEAGQLMPSSETLKGMVHRGNKLEAKLKMMGLNQMFECDTEEVRLKESKAEDDLMDYLRNLDSD